MTVPAVPWQSPEVPVVVGKPRPSAVTEILHGGDVTQKPGRLSAVHGHTEVPELALVAGRSDKGKLGVSSAQLGELPDACRLASVCPSEVLRVLEQAAGQVATFPCQSRRLDRANAEVNELVAVLSSPMLPLGVVWITPRVEPVPARRRAIVVGPAGT